MEEHTIQVAWHEGSKPLLRDEVRLLDELRAARVFRRLTEVLQALVYPEGEQAKGGA